MDILAEAAKYNFRVDRTDDGLYRFVRQSGPDTWTTFFVGTAEQSENMFNDPMVAAAPATLTWNQYRAKQIEQFTAYTIIVQEEADNKATLRVVDNMGVEHLIAEKAPHGHIDDRLEEIEKGRPLDVIANEVVTIKNH